MADPPGSDAQRWRRLSAWSIPHFAARAIVQNVQALVFAGPATYGFAQWGAGTAAWGIPVAIVGLVLIGSVLRFLFYSYRILDDSVQVRQGAIFRQNLDLSFEHIQNVSIEHPFYFRPLGLATLKIDGAGAKGEEVSVAALTVAQAEAAREFIIGRKRQIDRGSAEAQPQPDDSEPQSTEPFFTRSLGDLVIHGLTNNRSIVAIAGILGLLWQSNVSPGQIASRLGIDFDVVVAGLSLVRLAVLLVVSFLVAVGIIACLSVLVSIFTYYGFSMYRTADGLLVRRGLLTKHEIHVRKSRIQTITIRQDWLDRLLGRRNVILERISHSQGAQDAASVMKKRILVPSVREHETRLLTDQILPGCRIDDLPFTPIDIRYFHKHAAIVSVGYLLVLALLLLALPAPGWAAAAIAVLWPLHVARQYLSWRRGGLAVHGDYVVARSGAIGIDYQLFPAYKIQDVTHVQSVLMRRRKVSTLRFHTASTTINVPYMSTRFMRAVADYCVFRAETATASWM